MGLALLRLGFLLVHALHYAESAKVKAAALNLGDATLLVLDGLQEEGMKLAREVLARKERDVNLEVEVDDGSKGTPLAVAIHSMASPKAEDCTELVKLLLACEDIDVNSVLTTPSESTMSPLLLAMRVVSAGKPAGLEISKLLLAHEKIAVNAASTGASTLTPLHMALAAAARGSEAGLELTKALLARSDIDVAVEMVGPDGVAMTPLAKVASMLQAKPDDATLMKLHGMLEAAMGASKKDEL